jgi:guanylate kinase
MTTKLDLIKEREPSYTPGLHVTEELRKVTMVPLIGPFAVGKSVCMAKILEQEPDFGRVQSFTTRSRRNGEAEDEYRFLPDGEVTLDWIAEEIKRRDLVQYAVHPTTGNIYGSDLRDYAKPYSMLDALYSAVEGLRRLPFKDMKEITMVAEPNEWVARSKERLGQISTNEANKRLRESILSLEWSLEQGDSISWVCNRTNQLPETCQEVVEIVRGSIEKKSANRVVGEALLERLRILL